ncbi:hypothetical protein ACT3SZ_14855 [Corynebacterium sp. AOP40-9SA-29]|uniref:hypothetical protein n=1 Tax=Corynebacterium sp. AOP40-9SA-29 TaxID=3457677 RepID=UPI004033648E
MLDAITVLALDPPEEVTNPANTIIGWCAWFIAALCVGRLMFLGAKWGLTKISTETFDHTPREIFLTITAGVLCTSAGVWVDFLQNG